MRQVILESELTDKESILNAIDAHGGTNTVILNENDSVSILTFLPNNKLNDVLNDLSQMDQLKVSVQSSGALAMYPPQSDVPEKAVDVAPKSSFEIYLNGIQSVGSKFGLVGYSIAAGIIVWIGLYSSISFLLVAAMLVAPFAGPAMNAALATTAGRSSLLKKSLLRYAIAIGSGALTACLLTLLFPIKGLTPLMEMVSQVSKFAVLLPVVAGFAGAINICQSEQDSLVSGAAVGILVAASLAPPTGLLGIGISQWNMVLVKSSAFRILLQLVGIHASAALVFHFYGKLSPKGVRFVNGSTRMRNVTSLIALALFAGLIYWQVNSGINLEKASLKAELDDLVTQTFEKNPSVKLVSSKVEISQSKSDGKTLVLFNLTLFDENKEFDKEVVKSEVERWMKRKEFDISAVYDITYVEK
jgi:uncharacterized hydrophobic protein (TIGR00271 family)